MRGKPSDALKTHPQRVALLGLGSSIYDYIAHCAQGMGSLAFDEVWAVNMCMQSLKHDKLFVMDDLRVQADRFPLYGDMLRKHDRPIITSQVYPDFPMSVRFPIEDVIKTVGDDYFVNTVCFAIGYALWVGVKEISLYGCDFFYPNLQQREEGGMNAAYLLGLGRHFGMTFHIPPSTTLLGANMVRAREDGSIFRPLYGYATQPERNKLERNKQPRIKAKADGEIKEDTDVVTAGQNRGVRTRKRNESVPVGGEAPGS